MEIGLTNSGYKSVQLKCGSNSMIVNVQIDEEFQGAVSTKKTPCFYDTDNRTGQNLFQLQFSLNQCKTQQSNNVYSKRIGSTTR
ncbi:hypothetical protein NQ317_017112 [Molorchus minor]|uniref:ZP domain-containing protein n=1 Tax=Molorchus minor TaxID=1323400 RepID=A0ABQ9J4W0_9CUCU|nr:hypothetical protein NQ317_017112 [Molorchus minor]